MKTCPGTKSNGCRLRGSQEYDVDRVSHHNVKVILMFAICAEIFSLVGLLLSHYFASEILTIMFAVSTGCACVTLLITALPTSKFKVKALNCWFLFNVLLVIVAFGLLSEPFLSSLVYVPALCVTLIGPLVYGPRTGFWISVVALIGVYCVLVLRSRGIVIESGIPSSDTTQTVALTLDMLMITSGMGLFYFTSVSHTNTIKDEATVNSAKKTSEVFAKVSHDMRQPVHAISAFNHFVLQTILRGHTELKAACEKQDYEQACDIASEAFANCKSDVKQMTSVLNDLLELINDFLLVSKLEQKENAQIKKNPFRAMDLCERVSSVVSVLAAEKKIVYETKVAPDVQKLVLIGDTQMLMRVLVNLVSNAVQYTPRGGHVEVSIMLKGMSFEPGANADNLVEFAVTDTGNGIDPEMQQLIFEPFQRGIQTDIQTGSGLGLAIAQSLVSVMGGELLLRSKPGKGSTFYFSLLLPQKIPKHGSSLSHMPTLNESISVADVEIQALIEESSRERNQKVPYRILLADDNSINRKLFERMLSKLDFHDYELTLNSVVNGSEAVSLFENTCCNFDAAYKIIFLDNEMPIMDGLEATRRIRKLEKQKGIKTTPIVGVTASRDITDVWKKAGMSRFGLNLIFYIFLVV